MKVNVSMDRWGSFFSFSYFHNTQSKWAAVGSWLQTIEDGVSLPACGHCSVFLPLEIREAPQIKGWVFIWENFSIHITLDVQKNWNKRSHFMQILILLTCYVYRYRRFNVLGNNTKALNMAESQSGGMVADFRHLVSDNDLRAEKIWRLTKLFTTIWYNAWYLR